MSVRTADEILNQQSFAVQRRRQKQTRTLKLPAVLEATRATYHIQFRENFLPITFRIATLKVVARRLEQPGVVIQIQIQTQSVEPFEEHRARVGLLIHKQKLVPGVRQLLDERAPRRIGRFAALDAVGVKTSLPTLARSAVRTMRMLLGAVEVRPHRLGVDQLFDCRRVSFDFRKGGARRLSELLGEDVEDAGQTNERGVFRDGAAGKGG